MSCYLDPKNDLVFKRIFGEHPHLLKSFLNAVLPLPPGSLIESLQYLSPEQVPENPMRKDSIVDVKCMDNYKRQFIVEMQMYWSDFFRSRLVFNASKAYVRQLDRSKSYHLLQPVYGLGIINDVFDHTGAEFYHHYQTVNRENTDDVIRGLEFVLVELPKFKPLKWEDRKMAVLWFRFLREINDETRNVSADLLENADIQEALDLCEEGAFSPEELEVYDQYWDSIRTLKSLSESVSVAKIKSHAEGHAEGEAKGRAEGRAEGIAEGEQKSLISFVINCKRNGLSVQQIQAITGVGEEKILEILRSNSKE
jgi:predicted transposase/invertase (TIGR01784 family)